MKPGDLTVIEAYRQIWKVPVIRDRASAVPGSAWSEATAKTRELVRGRVRALTEAIRCEWFPLRRHEGKD